MADDNRIDLIVTDKIDSTIAPKLAGIATTARDTANAVQQLQAAFNSVNASSLSKLQSIISSTASSTSALAAATGQLTAAQAALANALNNTANAGRVGGGVINGIPSQVVPATGATNALSSSVTQLAAKLLTLWAAFGGLHAIGEAADEYTLLENKLRSVGVEQANLTDVMNRLTDAAVASRTPLESTATTFQRLTVATHDLGLSQQQVLGITETLNKSIAMSGASASAAKAGLYQLAEGMEANRLQGIHLKALITDLPMLARQIAGAIGTNVDGLRKMGTAGLLTAEVLAKALQKIKADVDAGYGQSVETVGAALGNLQSRFVQFVGNLNTATGATGKLAAMIDFFANHLALVATAVATVGVALLVVFGPTLIGMLAAATSALVGFLAVLVSNPVGLFLVALTAVIGLLATYSSSITSAADSTVNLADQTGATVSIIKDQFSTLGSVLEPIFANIGEALGKPFSTFPEFIDQLLRSVFIAFTSIVPTVASIISDLPAVFGQLMLNIGAKVADGVESFVNFFIDGINKVQTYANSVVGNKTFDLTPKFVIDGKPAIQSGAWDKMAQDIEKAQTAAVARFDKAAKDNSNARLEKQGAANAAFTKTGVAHPANADDGKAAEKRALALAKVNDELNRQLNGFGLLAPARAVQQQFDQIELQLAAKKITLNAAERASIMAKIQTIQDQKGIQQQLDAIYQQSIAPAKTYADTIAAANLALSKGYINQQQYGLAVRQAADAYAQFLDPLYTVNQQLAQQSVLLGKVGDELTVTQQLQQIQNQLGAKWAELSATQIIDIRTQLALIQIQTGVQQQLNAIYAETNGAVLKQAEGIVALNQAYSQGMISLDQYNIRLNQLAISAANTRLAMGGTDIADSFLSAIGQMTNGYQGFVVGATATFGDFFSSFEDGFANSIGKAILGTESFGQALNDVANQALQGLISGLIKVGLQYLINAAIGEGAAAASLATTTATASATAAAWAPAAALASLATFGSNSAGAIAAIAGTTAFAKTISIVPGFAEGGYTGNAPPNSVTGVVHGQEFVMNAAATNRIGVSNLEAMQRGGTAVNSNTSNAGAATVGKTPNIVINNHGTPQTYETESVSSDEVRLIARDEINSKTPSLVASHIANPNSTISKSMQRNLTVKRAR